MLQQAIKDFLYLEPKKHKLKKKLKQKEKKQPKTKQLEKPQKVDLKDYKEAQFEKQPGWFDLVPQEIREKPKKVRQSFC